MVNCTDKLVKSMRGSINNELLNIYSSDINPLMKNMMLRFRKLYTLNTDDRISRYSVEVVPKYNNIDPSSPTGILISNLNNQLHRCIYAIGEYNIGNYRNRGNFIKFTSISNYTADEKIVKDNLQILDVRIQAMFDISDSNDYSEFRLSGFDGLATIKDSFYIFSLENFTIELDRKQIMPKDTDYNPYKYKAFSGNTDMSKVKTVTHKELNETVEIPNDRESDTSRKKLDEMYQEIDKSSNYNSLGNLKILDIKISGDKLIVLWDDNTKTIVTRKLGEKDDPEKAIMAAMTKKMLSYNTPGNRSLVGFIDYWVSVYNMRKYTDKKVKDRKDQLKIKKAALNKKKTEPVIEEI